MTPNTNAFYAVLAATEKYYLFKVNNRNTGNTGIVLMSLLLTLSIYNTFFQCYYYWPLTDKCLPSNDDECNPEFIDLTFLFIVFTSFTKQLFFYKQLVLNTQLMF